MKNKINDINQVFKGKKLLAFDETTGEFAIVSPHIFTSTVYTEEGVPLDEYLTFKPQELIDKLDDILKDAPKEYDTFREIAAELNTNKDSIVEILRAISNRVKMPEGGKTGQVLKLNSDGQVVFDEDKDTIYNHPETHPASIIETDTSRRFVTDKEKVAWNAKLDEDSSLDLNSITLNNQKKLLKDILNQIIKNTGDLEGLIGVANGLASLDGNKKIPIDQLPDEALKDTTYDLTPYAKSEDLESTYAKISALITLKNTIEGELKKYASQSGLDKEVRKINAEIDKKESTIHKGEVNGYAALDSTGKVPEEQLPEKAIREYDLTPYAKSEDIKKTYATKEEVTSGQLDYTAENAANKGKANGYASLGGDGKVPAEQLPSYVDDVLEFASKANFPSTGEKGKIYVDLSTENIFRWSGSAYVEISPSLITQAEIKKLQGIEDGAEKNNVTQAMIDSWNKKITANDVQFIRVYPSKASAIWRAGNRPIMSWLSVFSQRTEELRESLDKKPDVVEMSLEDYNNLTTKNPNTIYATY